MFIKIAIIRKVNGKYHLYSKKKNPKTGKRRLLGKSDSLAGIKKRERAIQFFKYHADDMVHDKETKALHTISTIGQFLEEAGFIDRAQSLYDTMDLIDGSLAETDAAADFIPAAQSNPENQNYQGGDGIAGGYTMLNSMASLILTANSLDQKGLYKEAQMLDNIIVSWASSFNKNLYYENVGGKEHSEVSVFREHNGKETTKHQQFKDLDDAIKHFQGLKNDVIEVAEDDNRDIDLLVENAGKSNITQLDNTSSGQFSGLSDWYFYTNQSGDEEPYNKINI